MSTQPPTTATDPYRANPDSKLSSGEAQVMRMFRAALERDKRDHADLIAAVSRALGGPNLSVMDASQETRYDDAASDEVVYAEASRLMGLNDSG